MKARKTVKVDIWYMDDDRITEVQVLECISMLNMGGQLADIELQELN